MRRKTIMLASLLAFLLVVGRAAAQGENPSPPDPATLFAEPCINFDRGPGLCIYTQGDGGPTIEREILTEPDSGIRTRPAKMRYLHDAGVILGSIATH